MSYSPQSTAWVVLRSAVALETAMAGRDVNGNELAQLAGTSRQNIANMRHGRSKRVREDIGAAVERALSQTRGSLFIYLETDDDDEADDEAGDRARVRIGAR